ncbi:hypothetical protein CEY12_05765 [Chryseobacterium sp. T16E-39]|nr:hypothetical protein CEY12_05765 [Chryseobacterium sp. T16E-39]
MAEVNFYHKFIYLNFLFFPIYFKQKEQPPKGAALLLKDFNLKFREWPNEFYGKENIISILLYA